MGQAKANRALDASGAVAVQSIVEDGGSIRLNFPAAQEPVGYTLQILSPLGDVEGETSFSVMQDATPPTLRFDIPPPQSSALDAVGISGVVADAVGVTLNGVPVTLGPDGAFKAQLPLNAGENAFGMVALDHVGNVTLRQISIVGDQEAPVITQALAKIQDGLIVVTATATDNVGLRPVARFELAIGDRVARGFLRCDTVANICRATLPAQTGQVRLTSVEISDYAGNTNRLDPSN